MTPDRDDVLEVEAAELRLHADALPPAALDDFIDKLRVRKRKRPKLKLLRAEDLDEIADPVVASAFALAEEDLAKVEEEAIREEERRRLAPPPPGDIRADEVHVTQAKFRDAVADAAAAGVRFKMKRIGRTPDE